MKQLHLMQEETRCPRCTSAKTFLSENTLICLTCSYIDNAYIYKVYEYNGAF